MVKIMIVTPAFDGKVNVQYAVALSETTRLLSGFGIECMLRINTSGSLLVAERNRLTEFFMQTDCTHMLCIDSDLGWPARAVVAMIEKDEDFVVGCYPSRKEYAFLFRPMVNEDQSLKINSEKGLIEMEYIPAGFMLIRRNVIEKMREVYPELYFEPKHPDNKSSAGYCFFNTEIRDGEFWGEDYVFCRLAREAGFKIWADPLIEFDHGGNIGSLSKILTNKKQEV